MDYDPAKISYEQLLDVFWSSHYPNTGISQYRSIIFYHDQRQKMAAVDSLAGAKERYGENIQTAIVPYTDFYLAEDYHQKYWLRANSTLFRDISEVYPDSAGLLNSTAAARLNGYIGGFGDEAAARAQLDDFGLSAEGRQELLKVLERGIRPVCPVP